MRIPRSYLFVPGHKPDRFAKAAASGADRIIIDLEDAVGPADKDAARRNASDWFANGGAGLVRVNGADTPWFAADLQAVAQMPKATVMLPKANRKNVSRLTGELPGREIVALIETVEGLLDVVELASLPGVARLAFGNIDFGADARIPATGPALDPARFQIVIASSHAGLPQPIDGVTIEFQDDALLASEVQRARNSGFSAKLCIHPKQVQAVNDGLAPTQAELEWARRVLEAIENSGGSTIQLDGKMVDKPIVDRARALLSSE